MGLMDIGAKEKLLEIKDSVMNLERPLIENAGYTFEPTDAHPWYNTDAPRWFRMECHNSAIEQVVSLWEATNFEGYLARVYKEQVLAMLRRSMHDEGDVLTAKLNAGIRQS